MNVPLRRVAIIMFAMFIVLLMGITWIQYVKAPQLNADPRNVRTLYREYGTNRGPIVVADTSVALSNPVDSPFKYLRSYPQGEMYAAVTGYYSVVYGRSGLEAYTNEYLNGTSDALWLNRLRNLLSGKDPQGSAVETTIDPNVQQAAWDALGDQRGAVVALDPNTGAILAMVSKPSFDPNLLALHNTKEVTANYQALLSQDDDPLINRAIAGDTYPPGSTFKLITAAAAIEELGLSSNSEIQAPDTYQLPGTNHNLENFGGGSCSATGTQTLSDALRVSCNTAFAILGGELGSDSLQQKAVDFGFDTDLRIPVPVTRSRFPGDLDAPQTAISALGQGSVRTTPLQVAMISAGIANNGIVMKPYLMKTVRSAELKVVKETEPEVFNEAISKDTATELNQMMQDVVANGSGSAAQISGITVAGKTGTAQTGVTGQAPHAWFTGFAPANNPQVAVAVVIENGGDAGNEATGGKVAAPIAKAVIEAVVKK